MQSINIATAKCADLEFLTLWTPNYFCQTPVCADLIFSMLLLGADLIFANLPPDADLFFEPGKRCDPSQAFMPVTKKVLQIKKKC